MREGSKFENFADRDLKSVKFSQNFSKIAFLVVIRCNLDYDSKLRCQITITILKMIFLCIKKR